MMRPIFTGLIAGAAAVLVLTLTRPVVQPSAEARSRWLDERPPTYVPASVAPRQLTTHPALPWGSGTGRSEPPMLADLQLARLDVIIPEFAPHKTPLNEVLKQIRDRTGVNMVIDWRSLEAAGIASDAPVSMLPLKNLTARRVLRQVLAEAGGGNIKLRFEADDGIIVISTDDNLSRFSFTRVYDIRDILELYWPTDDSPPPAPVPGQLPAQGPYRGGIFGARNDTTPQEQMDALVRLIQETIDPTIWRDAGGSIGAIRALGGRLMVTLTAQGHRDLEEFLSLLRRLK